MVKVRGSETVLFSRYFMYRIYVTSGPSLLMESTDYDYDSVTTLNFFRLFQSSGVCVCGMV